MSYPILSQLSQAFDRRAVGDDLQEIRELRQLHEAVLSLFVACDSRQEARNAAIAEALLDEVWGRITILGWTYAEGDGDSNLERELCAEILEIFNEQDATDLSSRLAARLCRLVLADKKQVVR
jgi:hypothetical protein